MQKLIALILLAFPLTCYSQKTLPNKKETAEYIKGKLLTTGQFIESVEFDENTCILTVDDISIHYYEMGNLNANAMSWDVGENGFGKFMKLKIAPKSGMNAGTRKHLPRDKETSEDYVAEFSISIPKASDTPDFQKRIVSAFQRLIELCGGKKVEKDPFSD